MGIACQRSVKTSSQGAAIYAQAESAFGEGDTDKAIQLLQESLASYEKEGNEEGMATVWLAMAQVLTNEMQTDSALTLVSRAMQMQVDDSLHAALLNEMGSIHTIRGDFRQAVLFFRQAIEKGGAAFHGEDKAVACGNIAIAYRRLDMPDSARYFLEQGIMEAREVGDDEDLAFLYNNLATSLSQMNRHEEALEACHQAAAAAAKADAVMDALNAQVNEAQILLQVGKEEEALRLLEEALPKTDSLGIVALQVKTLTYLLHTCIKKDDIVKMQKYMEQGERLLSQIPPSGIQASGLQGAMAEVKIHQGDYPRALSILEQIDPAALQNGAYLRDGYLRQKARCMAGVGHFAEAYRLEQQAADAADTIRSAAAQRQLSELSAQLKAQERETEIARLNKVATRRQLYIALFAAGFAILALLAAFYVFQLRRRKERELAQKYLEGLERERARFARELHDGACNELLGIGMTIHSQSEQPEQVAGRIRQLRDTLRRISHELMPPQFDDASLDVVLHHYLTHIKTPDFNVSYSATGDFSMLPKHVAYELYRITQETMGNIITHASATKAQVALTRDAKVVRLSITDNGTWSEKDTQESGGIGLRSIGERAKSIDATLATSHDAEGTVTTVAVSL